ncbi:MAG: hypothetical protein M0D57_00940 [Sphingobacteriales bacterium JAD_PAG50586_3]|nr:MAG: hypothetical protein M0D57_00940 [Sphingobacteriales bacterium JAD_PAG50586_3]
MADTTAKRRGIKTVKKSIYNAGGITPETIIREKYDTNGRMVKRTIQRDTIVLAEYEYYYYDSSGNLVKYYSSLENSMVRYTYYSNGRLKTKLYAYDTDIKMKDKWVYFLDDAGRLTSGQRLTYTDNKLSEYVDTKYDSTGKIVLFDAVQNIVKYTYNRLGVLEKQWSSGGEAYDNLIEWFFNENKLPVKKVDIVYMGKGEIYTKHLYHYFYNDKNLIVKEWRTREISPGKYKEPNTESIYQYTFY